MALRWGRRVFHWASEHCGHFVVSFISMAWGSRSRYVCNWWHFSMVDRVMLFCQQNRFVNFRSFIFYLMYVHFRPGFHFLTIPSHIYLYVVWVWVSFFIFTFWISFSFRIVLFVAPTYYSFWPATSSGVLYSSLSVFLFFIAFFFLHSFPSHSKHYFCCSYLGYRIQSIPAHCCKQCPKFHSYQLEWKIPQMHYVTEH